MKYLHLYKWKFRWIIGTLERALECYKVLQILQVLQMIRRKNSYPQEVMHCKSKDYMGKNDKVKKNCHCINGSIHISNVVKVLGTLKDFPCLKNNIKCFATK